MFLFGIVLTLMILGMVFKIAGFAMRATWGITKLLIVLLAVMAIVFIFKVAIPVLLILGIIAFIKKMRTT